MLPHDQLVISKEKLSKTIQVVTRLRMLSSLGENDKKNVKHFNSDQWWIRSVFVLVSTQSKISSTLTNTNRNAYYKALALYGVTIQQAAVA